MARAKATVVSAPTFLADKMLDVLIPMGFVVQVDSDLSLKVGENPTAQRLDSAESAMFNRYESAILAALESVFGARVSYMETAKAYTGNPKTGIMRKVHIEPVAPVTINTVAPVVPAAPAAPKKGKGKPADELVPMAIAVPYTDQTVAELREECGERGLKVAGTKAVLVKRLALDDAKPAKKAG